MTTIVREQDDEQDQRTAPAWMGLTGDHLIAACPNRARSRDELERHGWWRQCLGQVDPDGGDLCRWCVRVWRARERKAGA